MTPSNYTSLNIFSIMDVNYDPVMFQMAFVNFDFKPSALVSSRLLVVGCWLLVVGCLRFQPFPDMEKDGYWLVLRV